MKVIKLLFLISLFSSSLVIAENNDTVQFMRFYKHLDNTIKIVTKLEKEINENIDNDKEVETLNRYILPFMSKLTILKSMANLYDLIAENKFNTFVTILFGNYNGLKQGDMILINQVYEINSDTQGFMESQSSETLAYWKKFVKIMKDFYSFDTDKSI